VASFRVCRRSKSGRPMECPDVMIRYWGIENGSSAMLPCTRGQADAGVELNRCATSSRHRLSSFVLSSPSRQPGSPQLHSGWSVPTAVDFSRDAWIFC